MRDCLSIFIAACTEVGGGCWPFLKMLEFLVVIESAVVRFNFRPPAVVDVVQLNVLIYKFGAIFIAIL
jgi:hypothetical protein